MSKRFFFLRVIKNICICLCVRVCVCCGSGYDHHTIKMIFIENIPNILKQQLVDGIQPAEFRFVFFLQIKRNEQTNKTNLMNA